MGDSPDTTPGTDRTRDSGPADHDATTATTHSTDRVDDGPDDSTVGDPTDRASMVAVAMTVMNVATYVFTMIAARLTGPGDYGAFVAALNLLTVLQVAALGVQASAARRIAAAPHDAVPVERAIMRLTLRLSLGLGVLLLLAVPLTEKALGLDEPAMAVVIALAAVPLTYTGAQMGVLQGERRWRALAVAYLMAGIPRLAIGAALLWWRPDAMSALLGVSFGYLFPVAFGLVALRRIGASRARSAAEESEADHSAWSVLRESLHNSQTLFAYFALSSVDILVARQVLDQHDSGLYAAGLILTKTMLFLPQFVVVIAFPAMSTPAGRRRALLGSLGLVGALGVAGTIASWALADVALFFVGGSEFAEITSSLWLFAVLGTLLSWIQLLVYSVLARQGRRTVAAVWIALVLLVVTGLEAGSTNQLLGVVIAVDLLLFAALLVGALLLLRREQQQLAVGAELSSEPPA